MDRFGFNLRIVMRTLPNQQWGIERAIRKLIKDEFSEAGIEFADRYRLVQEN